MDRNLWLAIALSVGVYGVWFGFIEKRVAPPPAQHAATATASASRTTAPTETSSTATPAVPPAPARNTSELLAQSDTVSLDSAEARIHPRGAAIVSFLYPEPLGRVELVSDANAGLFSTWLELKFKRDASAKNIIAYTAARADGLWIVKEFLPGEGTLLPRIRVTALNPTKKSLDVGSWSLRVGPGLGTIESERKENKDVWRSIALTPEGKGLKGRIEVLSPGRHEGPFRWIGIDNRYFLVALMPSAGHFEPVASDTPPTLVLTAKPVT
ncbi:MAG: hypothetical protein AAB262_02780, partial [Elusimicrobiota bacterium]